MSLPGGIICEICGKLHGSTIIKDRFGGSLKYRELYPSMYCKECKDKAEVIWNYLDKKVKMIKECICFPPKKEPHDKCCTCIQDESRGWKDCPEHGHKHGCWASRGIHPEGCDCAYDPRPIPCPHCHGKGYIK